MKQYTTTEQTAKLIELGFEKPKSCSGFSIDETKDAVFYYDYSIGELIEMLPAKIEGLYCNIDRCGQRSWAISYDPMIYCCNCAELIDALYDMAVKLKEEGVI